MTVLEKIKRCVSLVWGFQEYCGEEDIEDFCHNELRTYPQYDEIMGYFKQIEALEKENAELKERLKEHESIGNAQFWANVWSWKTKAIQLANAREIIKKFLDAKSIEDTCVAESEADQFLNSEVEK